MVGDGRINSWLSSEGSSAEMGSLQALRHVCAAPNFGKVEPTEPTGPCGGGKIAQARKASLRLQHPPA